MDRQDRQVAPASVKAAVQAARTEASWPTNREAEAGGDQPAGARIFLGTALMAGAMVAVVAGLPAGQLPAPPIPGTPPAATAGAWAVDPGHPGPNLPPMGRSLFDQLIEELSTGGNCLPREDAAPVGVTFSCRVPFPFAALVRRLEEWLGADPQSDAPLRRLLIPFSRSLQRNAASPEFWKYPRAVLAVDSERAPEPALVARPLLKDRLFLAYQEKAGVLEVISYNEEAGRFEFQVVRNYRGGAAPQLFYAQRALCTACHQNAAPIFPRQLWDETNVNPRIALELHRQGRGFYDFPIEPGVDVALAFQAAADRANLLAVYQLLWRQGCGQIGSVRGRSCRATLATAVLQQGLTGGQRFDATTPAFRRRLAEPFTAAWHARWPQGLAIPDPDLPNRDPMAAPPRVLQQVSIPRRLTSSDAELLADVVRRSAVPPRLEPLAPRPAFAIWSPDAGTIERLVAGLAGFLPNGDVMALDRRLFELGSEAQQPRRRWAATCRFELRRTLDGNAVDRVEFACGDMAPGNEHVAGSARAAVAIAPRDEPDPADERGPAGRLAIAGRIFLADREIAGGKVERIIFDGREELADLAIAGGGLREHGGRWKIRLRLAERASGLHARRAGGDAIEELMLTLPTPPAVAPAQAAAGGGPDIGGRAELCLLADFSHAERAIAELFAAAGAGARDVFEDAPFRRAAFVEALFARLGIDLPVTRPVAGERVPASRETAAKAMRPGVGSPVLRSFLRYCSSCHRTADTSPPNFLQGRSDQIEANLAHCAERLFFRLSMWQLDDAHRAKTPMPPVLALGGLAVDPATWPLHPDLLLLTAYAGELLRRENGALPRVDKLAARGYESLRSCLPPPGGADASP